MITWITGISTGYETDLARLLCSTDRLPAGDDMIIKKFKGSWTHQNKQRLLREALEIAEGEYVFGIDADKCDLRSTFQRSRQYRQSIVLAT